MLTAGSRAGIRGAHWVTFEKQKTLVLKAEVYRKSESRVWPLLKWKKASTVEDRRLGDLRVHPFPQDGTQGVGTHGGAGHQSPSPGAIQGGAGWQVWECRGGMWGQKGVRWGWSDRLPHFSSESSPVPTSNPQLS